MGMMDYAKKVFNNLINDTPRQDDLDELPFKRFIDQLGNHVIEEIGGDVKPECEAWLREKRNNFSGDAYIDQLEKNVIYMSESWLLSLSALTTFILTEYELTPDFINSHVDTSIQIARDRVSFHQEFINHGCEGCLLHDDHATYEGLKNMRNTDSKEVYIEELEFCAIYYKACFQITMFYIRAFTLNIESFNPYQRYDEAAILDTLKTSTKFFANICLKNVEVKSRGN